MQRLIEAARERLLLEGTRLRRLLQQSQASLTPLGDPLLVDFGTHRWLSKAREEVFSDWLQWIVEQLRTPEWVFQLFGIDDPGSIALCQDLPLRVRHEVEIPQGHEGQQGRLDLVIHYAEKVLIVVEVKKTGADQADTVKQRGYKSWMEVQPESYKRAVLLVVEVEYEEYEGFYPRRWRNLCIALRRIVPTLCRKQRLVVAAMILAFVGAVEQNLLRISSSLIRHIYEDSGQAIMVPSEIGDYIETSLPQEIANGNH